VCERDGRKKDKDTRPNRGLQTEALVVTKKL
jgi:hypothetical protein